MVVCGGLLSVAISASALTAWGTDELGHVFQWNVDH